MDGDCCEDGRDEQECIGFAPHATKVCQINLLGQEGSVQRESVPNPKNPFL